MPEVSANECKHLEEAAPYVRNSIALGESYVTGEFPKIQKKCKNMKKTCPQLVQLKDKPKESEPHQQQRDTKVRYLVK